MSELNRATILGTGTMGPGMGAVLARAGMQVTLFDVKPEALERAQADGRPGRGRPRPPRGAGQAAAASVSLRERPRAALATAAEIVIEAVPEQLELKQAAVRGVRGADRRRGDHRLQHLRHPDHEDRGGAARTPSASIGWHWSNPPHLIPMNEVIPGEQTAPR